MQNINHLRGIIFVIFLLAIVACASKIKGTTEVRTGELYELQDLISDTPKGRKPRPQMGEIRLNALKDTALSLGARGGLAWRSRQIQALLERETTTLDRVYNFNALILDKNVIPPVLLAGENILNLDTPETIRLADKIYTIHKQARFVTTPPTWRDYLSQSFAPPEKPDSSLLPRDVEEKKIWQIHISIGWKEGIQQANSIYATNMARLKRDYEGMMRYRDLLAQRMVSAPFVASADLGITGGGDELRINEQVLRITALPSLDANPRHWKPVLSSESTDHEQSTSTTQRTKPVYSK